MTCVYVCVRAPVSVYLYYLNIIVKHEYKIVHCDAVTRRTGSQMEARAVCEGFDEYAQSLLTQFRSLLGVRTPMEGCGGIYEVDK